MTSTEFVFMGENPHDRPRQRLRTYLREQYRGPRHVMRMAYDVGCSRKTAENILDGEHWPNDLTFASIVRRFGRDLLEAIFNPEIDPVVARLEEEERHLDRQLQAIRAKKKQASGRGFDHPSLFEALDTEEDR